MTTLGKLVDGELIYAPSHITVGDFVVYNPTESMLKEQGYKEIVETEAVEFDPHYHYTMTYVDKGEYIEVVWVTELASDLTDTEALCILLGGDISDT